MLLPSKVFSKEVPVEEAKTIAKNFFYKKANQSENLEYKNLNLSTCHIESSIENCFYVFKIEDRDGFVITSAQDFTKPILAYSLNNSINFSNLSPELRFILDGYTNQIDFGIENNAIATEEISRKWQDLRIPTSNRTSVTDAVGPLILTKWNQEGVYNDLCPSNSTGQAAVGCVAVAMAQVMKYYNYPEQGYGTKSFYDNSPPLTHYANINYTTQTYDWNSMPLEGTEPNEELAKLMYHCGHTVEMDWGTDGSGTQSGLITTALINYFRYDDGAYEHSKYNYWTGNYNYTDAQWELMIRNELDALRPIVYSGSSSEGGAGHAWNCDGYESDDVGGYLYHMNYGWGGYGDGYFALDDLVAGVVPGGGTSYFDVGHQIILGMQPEINYPTHCSENRTITGFEGLVSDGSGNEPYNSNINCQTLIQPECRTGEVSISFERFDLGSGDFINIHAGPTVDFPIIATLDQSNLPNGHYSSNNNGILLNFVTDENTEGTGWDLSYTSTSCNSYTFTMPEGEISDGSGSCDYETGLSCFWTIQPEGATQITLNFTEFDLDNPSADFIIVYQGSYSNPIATLNTNNPPSSEIIVNADKAIIRFISLTDDNVGDGFTLEYAANNVAIDNIVDFDNDIKVFPNPFSDNAYIELNNIENKNVNIKLTDIVGKTIAQRNINNDVNNSTISLNDLDINLREKGIYLLNITIDNQIKTYKLISE
jgi:hypothetical protein